MNTLFALAILVAQPPDPALWMDLDQWRFQPDPMNIGIQEAWYSDGFDDSAWSIIAAGERWEEEGGFGDVDGYAWYRYTFTLPEAWRSKPLWFLANGINDSAELYFNGHHVNTFGDAENSYAQLAVWALLPDVNTSGQNTIVVRVHDWGGSGGLWRLPVAITPHEPYIPDETMVALHTSAEPEVLEVETDFRGLGAMPAVERAQVVIQHPKKEKAVDVTESLIDAAGTVGVRVPGVLPGDELDVSIRALDAEGHLVSASTIEMTFEWPEPPGWGAQYAGLSVLNNFVTKLYDGAIEPSVAFESPRNGWVFLSVSDGNAPEASLNSSNLVWRRNPDTAAHESMRYLSEGEHAFKAKAGTGSLSIRTVPELAFCYYPTERHIEHYGPYNWAFMERHVLPHVNTLISYTDAEESEFKQWHEEGRRWIFNSLLPGLTGPALEADEVFEIWANNPGATNPEYAGFIADEFLHNSKEHYQSWTEAIGRIHDLPSFVGKTFYAWCVDIRMHPPAHDFVKSLMEWGDRFAWERYQPEDPTPAAADRRFVRDITQPWIAWQQTRPGINEHMIMCLGYMSAPPESLNVDPHVDYHVFMDMQFHTLATDPAFWNLYGIMEYSASYADEESLRWAHKLFRHYCIEGNTERLTDDPYILSHIQNADFTKDLSGWTVEAAAEESIAQGAMDGFSWLEGRYPRTAMGDTYCVFTRTADAPNRLSQTVEGLDPGRRYSIKMIAADIDSLDQQQELGLAIEVDGAESLPELSFQTVYPSCYAHELPPYNADHPAYFNFYRKVIRATSSSAELSITDWRDNQPAGPPGQRIAFNFIEVQPFR